MHDEIEKRVCLKCGESKLVILDYVMADRYREKSICKKCRIKKYRSNYIPKYLRGNFGVKL